MRASCRRPTPLPPGSATSCRKITVHTALTRRRKAAKPPPMPCCAPPRKAAPPAKPRSGSRSLSPMAATARSGEDDTLGEDDKPHEECGVFGVWGVPDATPVVALGLHALQHRGQEATGIFSLDGSRFHSHRGLGLVGDNFG